MAVDRRIWPAGEALLDLVYGLILGISVANRKLGPLLEIDDDGHRHPGSDRPVRIRRRARVPEQIASSGPWLADLRHSIFLSRRPMDYRLPVAENYTDGGQSRWRATISLVQVEPAIFDRRRTRKA
jgi:hypothetical protein